MNILNVVQGTPEWKEIRKAHCCASDAPAMLGKSKYKSRDDLLAGVEKPIDVYTQERFDRGHATEAAARAILESEYGFDFVPVVATKQVNELQWLASSDGICWELNFGFEHKLLNESLGESMSKGIIPEEYHWQMEHQLMVFGVDYILFTVSDGTVQNRYKVEYWSDPTKREILYQGWKKFILDKKDFVAQEKLVANDKANLPILSYEIEGRVVATNIDAYKAAAMQIIASINTTLATDQDFVDAESDVKWCKKAEEELEVAKGAILRRSISIADLMNVVDEIKEQIRQKRLSLEKSVKTEKENIKKALVKAAEDEVLQFCESFKLANGIHIPMAGLDLESSIKGKKTLSSMKATLSHRVIELQVDAEKRGYIIANNYSTLALHPDCAFLFSDLKLNPTIEMDNAKFKEVVEGRVLAYKIEQEEKAQEAAKIKGAEITHVVVDEALQLSGNFTDENFTAQHAPADGCCSIPVAPVAFESIKDSIDIVIGMLDIDESVIVINTPDGLLYKAIITPAYLKVEAWDINTLVQRILKTKLNNQKVV